MKSKPQWTKREKRAMGAVCVGIGLMLLVGLSKISLDRTPDILLPPPAVRPKPNGYDIYVAAGRALVKVTPPVDAIIDTQNIQQTNPRLAAQRYSLRRKLAWRAANTAAFNLFERAMHTDCMAPVLRTGSAGFPAFGKLRDLGRAKVIEAHIFQAQARPGQALNSCLDVIQFGNDTARGGSTLAKLVSIAIVAVGLRPLEDFDKTINQLSATDARASVTRLETILSHLATYAAALKVERQEDLREFLIASSKPGWRATWDDDGFGDILPLRQKVANRLVPRGRVLTQIQTTFDALDADAAAPYSPHAAALPEYTNTISSNFAFPGSGRYHQARETVALDLLLLRLALRAYRQEHGSYPAQLSLLAPGILHSIPLDDFSLRRPYHYRLEGGGYRLWSIGPDGVDDGGQAIKYHPGLQQPNPTGETVVMPDSKGDWVAGLDR